MTRSPAGLRSGSWQPLIRAAGLLLCALLAGTAAGADFTLALVPQRPPATLHRDWTAFTERLLRDTGHRLHLQVYRSFDEFEAELVGGRPDFAYMNPYHVLLAHRVQGYLPLVRDGSQLLTGVLVVRRDSPVRSPRDLDGRDIVFPDPNAFAASLYLRALLRERQHIRFHARYLTSHGNVYRHVILRRAAAGGGVNVTLAREPPETRAELRVLYETPGTAPHPLCAHPRVPAAVRAAVAAAVLRMGNDEEGRAALKRVDMTRPVRASYERDYRPLEALRLEKYLEPTQLSSP